MNRKQFIKLAKKVGKIRNFIMSFGQSLFGCLGFIFGGFALIFIISEAGQEVPYIFNALFTSFSYWIGITLLLSFIHLGMLIITKNKENWRKQ